MKGLPLSRPPSPILPSTSSARAGPLPVALHRILRGTVVVALLVCLLNLHPAGVTGLARIGIDEVVGLSCEERGLVTPASNQTEESRRVVIRVRATAASEPPHEENSPSARPFHPFLTASRPILFPGSTDIADFDSTPNPLPDSPVAQCIKPAEHAITMHPAPELPPDHPTLFFSACTTPSSVVQFAPVWAHFLGAKRGGMSSTLSRDVDSRPPGCVVVDAQGENDFEGMRLANEALKAAGTGCIMKESSRVGERYEMRVLGLVRDAWIEAERRRWQEGAPIVEWYIFGDQDTWWVDVATLKKTLLQFDPSEDHILGGFSEAKANFHDHRRIAYGGAGIIMSRSLVRKMQGLVGTCARKYTHIFGGDGILTNCAALAGGRPLNDIVEEVPGLSQMDMRGDASGFLSAGFPLLSIHHWVGWLKVFPNRTGIEAVQLLAEASDAIGGQNMFRRFVFDEGRTAWTAGYSVMAHPTPLSAGDLNRTEHTWPGFAPRMPSRVPRVEGEQKLTYYLTSVERLSPSLTMFHHTCYHPVAQSDLSQIDILWDSNADTSWWDVSSRVNKLKGVPKLASLAQKALPPGANGTRKST